jgi:hypothetical protein
MPAKFEAFIAMNQEICDEHVYAQLRDNLVEHLWARRENAT